MALDSVVRKAVAIAAGVTRPLQDNVTHRTWMGQAGFGEATYVDVVRKAIVEQKTFLHELNTGRMVDVKAKLTFLDPIPSNGAAGRVEPIDPKDLFVLPDGTTGQVVDSAGLVDPISHGPFLSEVWLGS